MGRAAPASCSLSVPCLCPHAGARGAWWGLHPEAQQTLPSAIPFTLGRSRIGLRLGGTLFFQWNVLHPSLLSHLRNVPEGMTSGMESPGGRQPLAWSAWRWGQGSASEKVWATAPQPVAFMPYCLIKS